jgi:AraC family transcriptional regulator
MSRAMLAAASLAVSVALAGAADPPKPAPAPPAPPAPAAAAPAPAAPAPAPAPAATPAAPAVALKSVEAIHALVVPMKGSYMQHGDAFGQLFGQIGAQGITPVGPPFGRYLNDATQVAEGELLWELGVPVGADVKGSAPLEVRDIAAGPAASLVFQGPPDSLGQAWPQVMQWAAANGYRPTGAPMMLFLGEPGPDGMRVELRLPVEKAQ